MQTSAHTPLVAWDTETALITDTCKAPALTCVSWATRAPEGIDSGLFLWSDPGAKAVVAGLLEGAISVGANIAYDMGVIVAQWPDLVPLVFRAYEEDRVLDVQIAQKLVDIAHGELHRVPGAKDPKRPYSLESLAWRHLQKELDKNTWRLGYGELRDVPLEQWAEGAKKYPIDDAITTLEVWEALAGGWSDLIGDIHRQCRHAFWLHLVSCWGIRTDPARVGVLRERIEAEMRNKISVLSREGLIRQEKKKGIVEWVRTISAAQERMTDACARAGRAVKLTMPSTRHPAGQVALDEETCLDSGDSVMVAYAEYASLKKRLSTDIPQLERGEIHSRFDSLKETGRSGCGEPYNLQNLPRSGGERECFIPRPGFVFADADYDGLESRAGAQACLEIVGESTMADVLNSGEDLHLHMAAALLGIDYAECVARYKGHALYKKTGGAQGKKDSEVSDARQFAKIANFGLSGGMGNERFFEHAQKELKKAGAKDLAARLTFEQTCEIRAKWLERWREWRPYFSRAGQMTEQGSATICHLFTGRYRGGLGYSDLCNSYFQGLGADAAKDAGWALTRACYDPAARSVLFGSRIVNFVHDQFIVEVPVATAHECAQELGRIMVAEANKWFPDVPATTTPCLATCWSKDATAIYDSGRLVPWSPEPQKEAA